MGDEKPRLVLASGSPRRRQLLIAAGVEIEVIESGVIESRLDGEGGERFALRMAGEKALAVARGSPDRLVLGADTIVVCGEKILGKPADTADAVAMLAMLSGRTHRVITAFALARGSALLHSEVVTSHVTFRVLHRDEIEAYVASGEPLDKAGAYGIQGAGGGFILRVDGSRDSVMGLPVAEVLDALRRVEGQVSAERELAARLDSLRARIDRAAQQAGRNPADVRLVLASKTQSAGAIRAAYDAGARDFGENYVQEGMAKRAALGALAGLRWHLIGHLQTNKVKAAATTFDLIQTVDSTRLAAAIMRERRAMRVLIEVNIGSEAAKSGVAPDRAEDLLNSIREQVAIEGLMAIPPAVQSAERARPYFARLRELRDRLHAATGLALNELSMGMSDDFEAAIEEGATMVRIGRAVFGERVK